jgi:hypothetical protein
VTGSMVLMSSSLSSSWQAESLPDGLTAGNPRGYGHRRDGRGEQRRSPQSNHAEAATRSARATCNLVKPMNHAIINDRYIADEHHCVVEFEVDHPEHGRVPIVDVFDIDPAGEITRLAVYRR